MKKIILLLIFSPIFGLAQQFNDTVANLKKKETGLSKITVEYIKSKEIEKAIPFFVNGKQYPSSIIRTIKPEVIKSIQVIEESKDYPNGAVEVILDENVQLNLISIKDLVLKETDYSQDNNIYFIDGEAIVFKAADYYVDQNNILKIVIKALNNTDVKYNLIDIYTKTEDNITEFKNSTNINK